MKAYTVVITSCGRFDLLERTLRTLQPHLDGPLDAVVVIEDSGDASAGDVVHSIVPDARVLVNERQRGQLASIDRAYEQVRTPLIFHCEDDWEFTAGGFLEDSATLLDEFANLSLVSLRPRDEINKLVRGTPTRHCDGVNYFRADPSLHPEYFGYSFNPGLRRTSDYRRLGPFASYSGEREISYCFKRLGYTMAYLEHACVTHIGNERHVDDPQTHLRARNLSQRLMHSCRLRVGSSAPDVVSFARSGSADSARHRRVRRDAPFANRRSRQSKQPLRST